MIAPYFLLLLKLLLYLLVFFHHPGILPRHLPSFSWRNSEFLRALITSPCVHTLLAGNICEDCLERQETALKKYLQERRKQITELDTCYSGDVLLSPEDWGRSVGHVGVILTCMCQGSGKGEPTHWSDLCSGNALTSCKNPDFDKHPLVISSLKEFLPLQMIKNTRFHLQ